MAIILVAATLVFLGVTFAAWRRYLWASQKVPQADSCPYSLTEVFGDRHLLNVPHQGGVRWLTEIFSRSAAKFPHLTALQIPYTGESLTFSELDARAETIASGLTAFVTGPDQIVAVAMPQDSWHIVAAHLGVLKAGGAVLFLDATLPDAFIAHMLNDAQPVVILTRGQDNFRGLPTLDVLTLPERLPLRGQPPWLDDPTQRLATIFYTSGTTGMPKGVECPHAGYVNLALSYADYFDLVPGMDATSLTSSLGYDGSISEMYSAWVSGCAVVMLTKEQIQSGPDLVPVLRDAEVTVLFCPPVLLTTLTPNPELDLPYPVCRYIVPAGEAFPSALVEPWTRARRQIINTYGPTEASTDTSRQSLRPGEPITIGSPFANVTYAILAVDGLQPLPHGEVGELCIGGLHVARGYRNLPEQTAKKFITHPRFGRLYRTGDKCRIDIESQRVHFLGRLDTQFKVRGHRVEAQAVEDVLQTQFSEIEAAVVDYQNEALVAFVVAPAVSKDAIAPVAPAPTEWAAGVTASLSQQLPAPSVPSRIFLVEKFVMKPVSGKIDRQRLPDLSHLLGRVEPIAGGACEEPPEARVTDVSETHLPDVDRDSDPVCNEVLAICRTALETPLGLDDGFLEAGGHSIGIARLAQRLRVAGWHLPVRALLGDCNTARKIAGRPRILLEVAKIDTSRPTNADASRSVGNETALEALPVGYFTSLQILFAVLFYSPGLMIALGILGFVEIGELFATASLAMFIAAGLIGYLASSALPFAALLWVMVIKLLMGRNLFKSNVTPGMYPKWSRMHLRIWCIERMESTVLLLLSSTYRSAPLLAFVLRRLGASVGRNLQCAHDAYLSGPLDLLSIGDNVAIQTGAYVQTTRWSGQSLHVGPVRLDSDCKIGMRAAIANDVTVGRGTWITPFTPILSSVGSQEVWEGTPPRFSGRCTELKRMAKACQHRYPAWLLETGNLLMQGVIFCCYSVIPAAAIVWFARHVIPAAGYELTGEYFETAPLPEIVLHLTIFAFVTLWLTTVVTSVLGCLFIRCTAAEPGLYPSRGLGAALLMYRIRILNSIQSRWTWTITGQYLRALAGVRFSRLGASECDVVFNIVPELITADAQVFWANGGFTNMLEQGAEHITLRRLDMPRNFFSGNNCVIEHGQFPSNFLLGVSTPVNDIQFRRQMRSRDGAPITVAGNPPMKFASASFESENEASARPEFGLFLARIFLFDFFSIGILRVAEVLAFAITYAAILRSGAGAIVGALAALVLVEVGLVLLCVAVKKACVGNDWGSNHATPFWSWRHFSYFFAQDCFFVWCRAPLAFLAGTVLSNVILRWMGCQIGTRTIVSRPMQCSDWNAVYFGNDVVVDGFLQFHTLENMILKVRRTNVQDRSTVAFGATVMGGAVVAPDTTLLPLSLVLKEMNLVAGTYEGSPAEPARDPSLVMATALR